MAKITRVTSKVFASGAAAQDIEQFGSKVQTGTPNYTTDPAVIQSLAAWGNGWSAALVVANKSEYKQDRNAVDYVAFYQISYLLQQGIAEYDASTPYYTNSVVQYVGNFYISLIDSNTGNQPDISPNDWRNMSALPTQTFLKSGSGTYTPPAGCAQIYVRLFGAGGGGYAGGTNGGNGGNTTFGAITAGGGAGATGSGAGAGGTASGGSLAIPGGGGTSDGSGGNSPLGGAGAFAGGTSSAASTNSGSGGGGLAGGGGAGGYIETIVAAPTATSYGVGAAGTAGSAGGAAGGSGLITIQEFYY